MLSSTQQATDLLTQLPVLDCILCFIYGTISFQISLVCLSACWFGISHPPPTMALAIHLQTSKYRLGTGTESELWHLINKVSLNRQNSLMKMTLKKDVCSYCHRGLRPWGDGGAAAGYALQECDLETERIMSWWWCRLVKGEVWVLCTAPVPIAALSRSLTKLNI